MTNRQYIGARYVPKFFNNKGSNEWIPNITYEALTIVTYLNNSYTSVKNVPQTDKTPNIDTDNWVLTGNYNAQIEEYRQKMINVFNNNSLVETTRYVLISDSYGVNASSPTRYSWFDYFKKLATQDNINVSSGALGGASFGGVNTNTYNDVLNQVINDMTDDEKTEVTKIIIGGGYNDAIFAANDAVVENSMLSFKTIVNNNFPNCKYIIFIWIGNSTNKNNKINIFNYMDRMKDLCYKNNIYFNNYGFFATHKYKTDIQSDGIHPTLIGAQNIGYCVYNIVNGKNSICSYGYSDILLLNSKNLTIDQGIREWLSSNCCNFLFATTTFTKTSNDINIGTFSIPIGYGIPVRECNYVLHGNVDGSDKNIILNMVSNNDGSINCKIKPCENVSWKKLKLYDCILSVDSFLC